MTSVLGYARTFITDGEWRSLIKDQFSDETGRLHDVLRDLSALLAGDFSITGTTPERMLQVPIADAMTHVGQLAMLRWLAGSPVPPENFIMAAIDPDNTGP